MTRPPVRRGRYRAVALALLTATLVPWLAQLPALATSPTRAPSSGAAAPDQTTHLLGDPVAGLADLDARGTALPSAAQRQAATALGAVDVRWNRFGTPSSILPADGVLAPATSSDPVAAARAWLSDNAAVFGLSAADVAGLELVNDQLLARSDAHAVLFRQTFGGLTPALGSMVTVGVANGEIAYVSSSLSKTTGTPPAATLSPVQAFVKAAAGVGRTLDGDVVGDITSKVSGGWTRLTVPGFAQEQMVRPRALALADGSVRPVFETNVLDVEKGSAFAYTVMVDGVTGAVLHRQNQAENSSDAFPFTGEVTATDCGPKHEFELTDDNTKQIVAVAAMALTSNDVVVKIFDPAGELLVSGDLGTSPETATYSAASIPAGIYSMQVCPFDSPTVPFLPPGNYAAAVTTSDTEGPGTGDVGFSPSWRYFTANPTLDFSADDTPTNSVVGCWVAGAGCTLPTGALRNVAAPGPWDITTSTGESTLTTVGNNANTHEAWASPLTPGGTAQAPVSPTREYTTEFTDAWNNSGCDPSQLTPGGADIDASVTNLFVAHNRMHDYAYYLGFTEANYNMQLDNLGRGGVDGDQEIGNAQAGALTGGQPSYLGRDNANQITLQDGTPGITNQYLFQPIAGAFYAPCTDGGLDMGIVGHEYTHAISNRMIGGPDEGITSEQGGAMGESWGDLTAGEYMFSHGYSNGGNPWAVGVYATGNKAVAIRDYAINRNPLNYSDYGFDSTGPEVHADGEIWNGTQWSVRQALVKKWNKKYPYTDKALQLRCAQGTATQSPLPASKCPGNRRWIQLVFDSFLLQQGATSMLDARDAMLAADRMRFGGKDLKVMWGAFASRGMGKGATTPNADSSAPRPSFASPKGKNGTVTFTGSKTGKIFVGHYEARVTPVADLIAKTKKLDPKVQLTPGRYEMLYTSAGHGFSRFHVTVKAGKHTRVRVKAPKNLAAKASGAKVLGSTAGSLNAGSLIDGTEKTAWGGVTATNVDESRPFVAVDLAGGVHQVRRVQVSAMLNPAPGESTDVPLASDPDSGSRFTALRQFALEACVKACSSGKAVWKRFYVSKANAFPALRPRPVAPNLTLRSFKVPTTKAAAIRFVVLQNQCTGYAGYAGEQDNDPTNDTDCATASDRGTIVHAAELQVF
ncbi:MULTISPECIES: M36 family metallopeptidase [unclassified Nocardioides]|uniref:M36 family metallopeptidase n=1 Tax=unclassified Nocardioides TaxID=2615069 RepID=UPI0009F039A1|nr:MULTISPECIES: M36 family metallopeptidase [unclassified Nocardioides]GAW50019.1 peptidase M36, fungalysin [Nocardioides sp. PD653-B2]GAW55888.1 peptidase M36, fungalysin [Nocardioides sp. PD653]